VEVLTTTSLPGQLRGHVSDRAGPQPDDGFDALFFAHAGRLVRLAALLGAADPEDVVQEAFARVFAARSRLTGDGGAYLTRVVVNEVRDRHRRLGVARRGAHLVARPDVAPEAHDVGERAAVLAALARLPQRQREALVLRFWLDLPLGAIAETMGVRTGTVKSQISRGLDALHADLSDLDDEEVGR
jgi:RNA polymerase sigma factor (sigma-70 family)